MPPEDYASVDSGSGGGSNIKFYAILVAIVIMVGIVALAWVLSDDDDESASEIDASFPGPIVVSEEGLYELPEDVRFRMDFDNTTIYANDAQFLNNCAMLLDDWWEWRDSDGEFGYYRVVGPVTLVGELKVFDLRANIISGTPTGTNE